MDAILFSANPKIVQVTDAVEHLADHEELYWEVGFSIVRDRDYPMYGFIHICGGQVEYRVSIRDIVPFSSDHYEDKELAERVKPKPWLRDWKENRNHIREHRRWKNALVMTEIMPFSYDTCSFQKCDGTKVKKPPEGFVYVFPPSQAPANRAQSGSSVLVVTRSGRSQPDRLQNIHEAYLEELIASDLDQVEPGLTLIGRQHDAGAAGRIDLLCRSSAGDIVVVELKRIGAKAAGVVEQTMAYVGWAHRHLAGPNQQVRGIIVGGKPDKKLQYTVEGIPNLKFRSLKVSIGDTE